MTSPFRLDGKTVLISGAGGGIGQSLVKAFREAGASVIGADREAGMLEGLDLAGKVLFDQADPKATRAAVERYLAEHGAPDAVVSNAGFTRAEHLDQVDDDVWASELAINLNGAYAMTDPIVAAMAARGRGSLVFISSVNALAHYGNPAYSAAKAGLVAYAKAIAVERGGRGRAGQCHLPRLGAHPGLGSSACRRSDPARQCAAALSARPHGAADRGRQCGGVLLLRCGLGHYRHGAAGRCRADGGQSAFRR